LVHDIILFHPGRLRPRAFALHAYRDFSAGIETTVKAIVAHSYGPVENLRFEDRPDPIPSGGEVLIDVSAAAINYPDILVISGKYQVKPPLPFIPGKELAGTVAAYKCRMIRLNAR
jgi:Alcohol dehydrogenase GroES-like domain